MNTTTRRYPRTLREAFPGSAEYACAVERPHPAERTLRRVGAIAAVVVTLVTVSALLFA